MKSTSPHFFPFERAFVFTIFLIGVAFFVVGADSTFAADSSTKTTRETVKLKSLVIALGDYEGAKLPFVENLRAALPGVE